MELFSIETEHMFYAGSVHPAFRYVATAATVDFVRRSDMLVRPFGNGIAVFGGDSLKQESGADADGESTPMLVFKIFPEDPYFTQYTLPVSHDADTVPYFQSDHAQVDDDGRWRLHEQEYVDKSALQNISAAALGAHLDRRDFLMKPSAVVAVALAGAAAAGGHYYLRFFARKSFWKYYFFSEADAKNFSIIDLDNEIRFECTGVMNFPGNKRALMFLSDIEIEMRQKYARRFQLREQNGMGEKVLIRRLPNASVSRMSLDEKGVLAAEIYIN
jgi:hypothetical protein